jgi:hypothetical protein
MLQVAFGNHTIGKTQVLMIFKFESGVSSIEDADTQYIHQQAKQMKM